MQVRAMQRQELGKCIDAAVRARRAVRCGHFRPSGQPRTVPVGAVLTAVGSEIASHTAAPAATGHMVGLLLIGIGWCGSLVAGSALMTEAFEPEVRVATQATADVLMTATGAAAGVASGLAVEQRSNHDLAHWATFVSIFLAVVAAIAVVQSSRVDETEPQSA